MPYIRLLAAGAALLLTASPAFAKPAMLSVGTTLHEGPGDEYAVLADLPPGRIDLGQCVVNPKRENWCFAERPGQSGWIYVLIQTDPKAQEANTTGEGAGAQKKGGDRVASHSPDGPKTTAPEKVATHAAPPPSNPTIGTAPVFTYTIDRSPPPPSALTGGADPKPMTRKP